MYFREKEKWMSHPSLLTVLSKLNDCWGLLWNLSAFCWDLSLKMGPRWLAGFSKGISGQHMCNSFHMSLQPGIVCQFDTGSGIGFIHSVNLIPVSLFRGKYTARVRLIICCLFSQSKSFYPPSLLSLCNYAAVSIFTAGKRITLILLTNSLA